MSALTYEIEELEIAPGVLFWGAADIAWSATNGSDWRVVGITTGFEPEGADARILDRSDPLFALIRDAIEAHHVEHIERLIECDEGDDYVAPRSDFDQHNTLGL